MTARDTPTAHDAAQALLAGRYGDAAPTLPPPEAGLNPVLETLLSHRSVRAFEDRPLSEGTLEWLVAAAQSAPSSSNLQTWSVVAVQDPARKAHLAELAGHQEHIRRAPLLLVWLADLSRLQRLAEASGQPAEGLHYLDTWLMGVIDASLAAQNAVSAAASLGLGTVYIGALRNRPEDVGAALGLPAGTSAVFGLCVGHPDPQRPASVKPRLPVSAVLSRERFAPADLPGDVAGYDAQMQAFQARQGLPVVPWSAHSLARLKGPADLKGRHRLVEALRAQGFELR